MSRRSLKTQLLQKRYLLKDAQGQIIESLDQMVGRVAHTVSQAETLYGADERNVRFWKTAFYELMRSGRFLPNSPTLMNAGCRHAMLSACFVLPVGDSIAEIFDTVKHTALIQKSGGGTGFSFDRLRPTGDHVASSGGQTSGPISFWRVLAETTQAIQQGAHRRGANMGMMSITHPDILKFITTKQDPNAFSNFNISVKVTDAFMQTLQQNPTQPHTVINPRNQQSFILPKTLAIHSYRLDDLRPPQEHSSNCYTIGDVWQLIIEGAHANGEPGVFFIDRANQHNPTPHIGSIDATNPCGEQPLLDYESCNLGSLNLAAFVLAQQNDIDWQALAAATEHAIRFLDNVIDINDWPIPQVKEASLGNRKIGLGVMGFADMLVLLGIRYDSDEAIAWAERIAQFINDHAHQASCNLVQQRGNFPNWPGSCWDTEHHQPMRNASCTTIAPTGSISIIAETSSGIEPIYQLGYKRIALDGEAYEQIHPLLETLGQQQGWLTENVRRQFIAGTNPADIPAIPTELAKVLVTAHQISPQ